MSCDPEQVTGYVDGALAPEARAGVEAHVADCSTCQRQADEERSLRERLRRLPEAPLRRGFEGEVRRHLRAATRFRKRRILLPLAASLALIGFWTRGAASFVAWELARDHAHCFGAKELPAKVWSNDPAEIEAWFEKQGTPMPTLPASAGSVELVGARYCPLPDATLVAHTYYGSRERRASLFVVPRSVRFTSTFSIVTGGRTVRLFRVGGQTLAAVSEQPDEVDAFERVFRTTVAGPDVAPPHARFASASAWLHHNARPVPQVLDQPAEPRYGFRKRFHDGGRTTTDLLTLSSVGRRGGPQG